MFKWLRHADHAWKPSIIPLSTLGTPGTSTREGRHAERRVGISDTTYAVYVTRAFSRLGYCTDVWNMTNLAKDAKLLVMLRSALTLNKHIQRYRAAQMRME